MKVSLFTWGLWAMQGSLTMRFMVGTLSHTVSTQPHRSWRLRWAMWAVDPFHVCDWTPIKILDIKSQMSFATWQYCALITTDTSLPGGVNRVPDTSRSGQLEGPRLEPSWTLPHPPLSFADFNLYPCTAVNHNCEYNSSQRVLWVFLLNYQIEECLGSPNLQLVSEVTVVLQTIL